MGGIVSGFFGADAPSQPNLQVWQPQYQGAADTQAYNTISNINSNNPYYSNQPAYQGVLNAQLNNPYAQGAQTAANTSGQQLATTGQNAATTSGALNQGAMSLLPYVQQVENTAMDPQNALYNQTKQNVQNQAGVSNAQSGLTNSPYGASLTNNANTNFNIDWQNNQLGRQAQGISSAATGLGAAGQAGTTAYNLGNSGAQATLGSGAVPLTAYNNNLANLQNALNAYSTSQTAGNANSQTAVSDLLSYLGLGATQSDQQANFNQTAYGDAVTAANTENQGISSLTNSLLGGLNSFGGGFSSGMNQAGANSLMMPGSTSSPMSDDEWMAFLAAA